VVLGLLMFLNDCSVFLLPKIHRYGLGSRSDVLFRGVILHQHMLLETLILT
jgi:hypothetical protein